jgi:hypothetical protein
VHNQQETGSWLSRGYAQPSNSVSSAASRFPTHQDASTANSSLSGVWQRGEEHWSADHERDCEPCFKGGSVSDGGGGGVRQEREVAAVAGGQRRRGGG